MKNKIKSLYQFIFENSQASDNLFVARELSSIIGDQLDIPESSVAVKFLSVAADWASFNVSIFSPHGTKYSFDIFFINRDTDTVEITEKEAGGSRILMYDPEFFPPNEITKTPMLPLANFRSEWNTNELLVSYFLEFFAAKGGKEFFDLVLSVLQISRDATRKVEKQVEKQIREKYQVNRKLTLASHARRVRISNPSLDNHGTSILLTEPCGTLAFYADWDGLAEEVFRQLEANSKFKDFINGDPALNY